MIRCLVDMQWRFLQIDENEETVGYVIICFVAGIDIKSGIVRCCMIFQFSQRWFKNGNLYQFF